ncbi:hypothetical protein C8J56DRAFT_909524 [Mycena floridula]|nr:hypothetical protein C8J56DRAFT_909524 [Mycena floridula]
MMIKAPMTAARTTVAPTALAAIIGTLVGLCARLDTDIEGVGTAVSVPCKKHKLGNDLVYIVLDPDVKSVEMDVGQILAPEENEPS